MYPGGRQDQEVMLCDGNSELPPGVSPGYRRMDHVIGIVAEILIADKVSRLMVDRYSCISIHVYKL